MRRKKVCILGVILAAVIGASPCKAADFTVEDSTVYIPGIEEEYHLIFMSDMHIIVESDEVQPEYTETVQERIGLFQNAEGTVSQDLWIEIASSLDSLNADAVLMGGDMIDYASVANIDKLQEGLSLIETPVMYLRSDHDNGIWYDTMTRKEAKKLHKEIDGNNRVSSIDMGEFLIVGFSNSTNQISEKALEKMQELFSEGKPIILVTHVPFESTLDDELNQLSRENREDRELLWGEDTYYKPNENMQTFLDMIYAEDSPVTEVLCGHLHFEWEGYLTPTVHEHVANPAFQGTIEYITVTGQEES